MLKTIGNRRTSAPSVIRPQMAARLIRLRKTLAAGHTADYSTRIRLVRGGRFFLLGVQIRRTRPSRFLQQGERGPNRHGKVRGRVFCKDRESDSYHAA